ncbi:hypothetical protein ANN_03836 [Periplaneta americana]|uniref:AMP-dependent synthetase/ligase domain-containing protein n=1 Tax=Periplaneta americana TaxID=6978 RepID=A0ABQ8U242_PERAM|nr:hypothetical protein ANN_03836 [Periplaneta americana]
MKSSSFCRKYSTHKEMKINFQSRFCIVQGAYLPVELSYPPPLLRSVLEDARPVAVCSKAAFADRLTGAAAKRVLLDAGWLDRVRGAPRPVLVRLDDMAYTVYSSGTTGRPKGLS